MTHHDILLLAQILSADRGVALSTVSRWVTGGRNTLLFDRIAAGHGCSTRSINLAAAWFRLHWPVRVQWPPEVRR